MTDDDTGPDMAKDRRHVYGPRAVGTLVPTLTRPTFKKSAPAAAQIMADWPMIVGPKLAEVTEPKRISAGTLTLACSGPVAMQLQHMAIELINRINTHLGTQTVRAVRFMQVASRITPPPPPPPARAVAEAEKLVTGLPPGELRDALVALGAAVLAPRKPSTNRTTKR